MSLEVNVKAALARAAAQVPSQAVLARRIGVGEGTLSRWLRGRMFPGAEQRRRIAQALKLDLASFALPGDLFLAELDRAMPIIADERAGVTILDKHKPLWPAAWPLIRGYHKLLYTHRDGTIEVSEIVFVALHQQGVLTRLFNWDVTKAARERRWEYEGYLHIIDGYGYASLEERKGLNEIVFLIFRMPTGTENENIHGHLLVRGTKGSLQRTAVSPCVLVKTGGPLKPGAYGTFSARTLHALGALDVEVIDHLTDMPTANLAKAIEQDMLR